MYLSNRLYVMTGLVLIAIAVCLVLSIVIGIGVSDTDPTSKADTAKMLKDTFDHRTAAVISLFFSVLLDAGFTLLIAPLTFLLFRDRSRVLGYIFFTGFIGSAVLSSATDGVHASVLVLAKDYAHGGAGVNAGDPAILELTHVLQVASSLVGQWGGTMLGIAFLALGLLIARAPMGNVNPPRAIGWIIVVDGIAQFFGWAQFVTGAAFLAFIVFGITTLIFTIWLGIWLITNGGKLPMPAPASV